MRGGGRRVDVAESVVDVVEGVVVGDGGGAAFVVAAGAASSVVDDPCESWAASAPRGPLGSCSWGPWVSGVSWEKAATWVTWASSREVGYGPGTCFDSGGYEPAIDGSYLRTPSETVFRQHHRARRLGDELRHAPCGGAWSTLSFGRN